MPAFVDMTIPTQAIDGVKTFRLPSSELLFTSYFHRELVLRQGSDKLDMECAQWADSAFQTRSPKRLAVLYEMRAYTWTSLCYPTCEDKRLRPVADYFVYMLFTDDITDKMSQSSLNTFATRFMDSHHCLDVEILSQLPDHEAGFLKLTRE